VIKRSGAYLKTVRFYLRPISEKKGHDEGMWKSDFRSISRPISDALDDGKNGMIVWVKQDAHLDPDM